MPRPASATESSTMMRRPQRSAQGPSVSEPSPIPTRPALSSAKLTIVQVPIRLDARGRERHRKDIESVQHIEANAECDHGQLEGRDRALREPALHVLAHGVAHRLTLK